MYMHAITHSPNVQPFLPKRLSFKWFVVRASGNCYGTWLWSMLSAGLAQQQRVGLDQQS